MVNTEIRLIIFFAPKMEKLYTVSKTRLGVDCGSDHELIAKFRLKLKKVGKITWSFRYDLNQSPFDYTVEVSNRFKGIRSDRQSAWRTMDGSLWHCIGGSDQDHPQEKEMQKGKIIVWGGLTIAEKRSEAKGKGENERYTCEIGTIYYHHDFTAEASRVISPKAPWLSDWAGIWTPTLWPQGLHSQPTVSISLSCICTRFSLD